MGSVGFLANFEFYMAVLGFGSGRIGLVAPWRFKALDSQPEMSNTAPVPTDFHDLCDSQKKCRGFLARDLPCFRPGCFLIHIFEVFGRKLKDARRKDMQIRGGITAGSALL